MCIVTDPREWDGAEAVTQHAAQQRGEGPARGQQRVVLGRLPLRQLGGNHDAEMEETIE